MKRFVAFFNIIAYFLPYVAMAQGPSIEGTLQQKNSDWSFYKGAYQGTPSDLCWAETQKKVGDQTWTLQVLFDPSRASVPTFLLGTTTPPDEVSVRGNSSSQKYTFLRSAAWDQTTRATFWFVPLNASQLYKQLRRDSNIRVDYKVGDKTKNVYLSLAGSMKTFDALSKSCNDGKDFFPTDFFDYLDKVKVAAKNSGATADSVQMRAHVNKAWQAYIQSGVISAEVKKVDAQIKPLSEKERTFLERAGLLDKETKDKIAAKQKHEIKLVELRNSRSAAEVERKTEEVKLEPALAVLKKKQEIYAPLAERARPFIQDVESAEAEVYLANTEHSRISAELHSERAAASAATAQSQSCQRDLQNNPRSRIQVQLAEARENYRRFEYSANIDRALNDDSLLASYRWQLRNEENDLDNSERAAEIQERVVANLRTDLMSCQIGCRRGKQLSTEVNFSAPALALARVLDKNPCKPGDVYCGGECHSSRDRCPGREDRDRDEERQRRERREREERERERERREREERERNRERREREERERERERNERERNERERREREQREREARERREQEERECLSRCSVISVRLNSEQLTLSSLESRVSSEENDVRRVEAQVNARIRDIEAQVRDISDRYESAVRKLEADLVTAERAADASESCIREAGREIEQSTRQIRSLEVQLNSAAARLSQAGERQTQARNRFSDFAVSSGYNVAKKEYQESKIVVDQLRVRLDSLDRIIKDSTEQITRLTGVISELAAAIDNLVARAAQNTSELQAIEEVLNPLRQQRQQLTEQLEIEQKDLLEQALAFKALVVSSASIKGVGSQMLLQKAAEREPFYLWDEL